MQHRFHLPATLSPQRFHQGGMFLQHRLHGLHAQVVICSAAHLTGNLKGVSTRLVSSSHLHHQPLITSQSLQHLFPRAAPIPTGYPHTGQ
jgi:hypothetical protein